MVKGKGFPVLK